MPKYRFRPLPPDERDRPIFSVLAITDSEVVVHVGTVVRIRPNRWQPHSPYDAKPFEAYDTRGDAATALWVRCPPNMRSPQHNRTGERKA